MDELRLSRLLLAILDRRWAEAERLCAGGPPDPDRFLELCRACEVAPWVDVLLRREGRQALVGAAALERLAAFRQRIQRDNLLLLARADQALGTLLEAGVAPLALKGLDFLHRLYDRFDERTLVDIDLLVAEGDLPAALAALEHDGWRAERATHYVRSSHHLPLIGPGQPRVELELHWNLAQERRYTINPAALLERAQPLTLGSRRILRLDDHDAAAHLLLHHVTHYFDRPLKWALDLERLAARPGFDWRVVTARAVEWGATAACALAVAHLGKLFPRLIPPEVARRLPVAAWRRALTWPLRSDHPLELFRDTRSRRVQLYLAAAMMENPAMLPLWMVHRARRDRRPSDHPLDAPQR